MKSISLHIVSTVTLIWKIMGPRSDPNTPISFFNQAYFSLQSFPKVPKRRNIQEKDKPSDID